MVFIARTPQALSFQAGTIKLDDIKSEVKRYVRNETNDYDLPKVLVWQQTARPQITMTYTNYYIFLLYEPSVGCDASIFRQSLHFIVEALSELRCEYAKKYFDQSYQLLGSIEKSVIDEMVPIHIYTGDYVPVLPPSPSPLY